MAGSKRALGAAALSALLPGSGQIYLGARRKGIWFLCGSLALVALVVAALLADSKRLLKLAFDPEVLIALLAVNAVVFVFRTAAVVDAFKSAGGDNRPWAVRSAALGLGIMLVAPHAVFAYYDAVQYDLINTVFAAPTPSTTTSTAAPVLQPLPSVTQPPSDSSTSTAVTTTLAPTTTTQPPVWDGLGRLNILFLGSDAGVGRTGVRTDTMILASIDPESGDMALIGIPRNFARVPLPETVDIWSCDCFPPILNELYQYGEDHPDRFPGPATPGANAIKGAVSELTGLPVHFYALVALEGFVDVVDVIGGVTITVTERVYDPRYPSEGGGTEVVDIQPGTYDFDGHEALAFARTRYNSDDYSRMGRQRCVIEAVVEQADPFSLLRSFPALADVTKSSVETDIPLDAVPDLLDLVGVVDTDDAISLRLVPPTYVDGLTADGFNIPDSELIREHAEIATTLSPAAARDLLGIDPLADACP